jgi:flagellar protein FlaG
MRENIQEAIDRLNQQLKANGRDLSFQMDEDINRPIITVRNIETGEVVRQIPSEEIIRMAHTLEEGKGLMFNESL